MEYLLKEGDELSSGELVQLPRVLHLVQLPVQVLHLSKGEKYKEAKYESAVQVLLHLLLQLEELFGAAQLLQLLVLVPQTLVLRVDLLALKPHLIL